MPASRRSSGRSCLIKSPGPGFSNNSLPRDSRVPAQECPWNTLDRHPVLRMPEDAKKPLRPEEDAGKLQPPSVVGTRTQSRARQSPGQRAVGARDRANMHVGMGMKKATKGLGEDERAAEMKTQLRERSQPVGRAADCGCDCQGAVQGFTTGEGDGERDPRADSPFIDTTEPLMNRMIRRQELVPLWTEKQLELTKAVRVFRERPRNDWKRDASSMMASEGGSLEHQMRRAAAFAARKPRDRRILSRECRARTMSRFRWRRGRRHIGLRE